MRIELFSNKATDLALDYKEYPNGIDFEGDVWTDEDGNVDYRGRFTTFDENENEVEIEIEPDPYDLCHALDVDIESAIMDWKTDYLSYLADTE